MRPTGSIVSAGGKAAGLNTFPFVIPVAKAEIHRRLLQGKRWIEEMPLDFRLRGNVERKL
jgi:hypothetical protein